MGMSPADSCWKATVYEAPSGPFSLRPVTCVGTWPGYERGTTVVYAALGRVMVKPITGAGVITPTKRPICWLRGVAPTGKPVLRSWLVLPPLEAATQTMAP